MNNPLRFPPAKPTMLFDRVGNVLRNFRRARKGAIGVALSLLFVPTVMVVGAAVDYARLEQFKTQLQATVDSAALSGAAAYIDSSSGTNAQTVATNYLSSNEGMLPSHIGNITSQAHSSSVTTGSNAGYTVSVWATATIGTTFMRIITPTMTVSASATAVNPLMTITISASHFNASAADANTLYYWLIPANASTTVPSTSGFTSSKMLASNTQSTNPTVTIQNVTATQQVGMALKNVTGQLSDYGCTQYQTVPYTLQWVANQHGSGGTWQNVAQSCQGTLQWFFSNIMPPSNNTNNESGYQAVTQNCSLQVSVTSSIPTGTTPPASNQCFSSLPTNAIPSCASLGGKYATFYWNDMGGTTDDKDYNDAQLSISCSSTSSNTATGVYLSS